ncbi:hypothetical protein AGDE_08670 [Angomonas deanei]|nr:hypothetical protein AGDE_08670 [Angomonas deanei]|eukprot:EPY32463.1 hypothetical protein AGDE_08670 [Angomonas deanei]
MDVQQGAVALCATAYYCHGGTGGLPEVYVFDANSAGSMLQSWYNNKMHEERPHDFFICACSAGETLPLSPALPADMLTACLTTPLRMALEWYIGFSHHKVVLPQVSDEMIRNIPGSTTDPSTPLGELHWILTAICESIAWCTLSLDQFQYLFRQDSATSSLFRNVILADRLLRAAGCTPVTHPPMSELAHRHPLWELWVYSLERVVSQLPILLAPNPTGEYVRSTFFDDQIAAFDIWIESGDLSGIPEQLPSVLLALYQPRYHIRVFLLLIKYLDSCRAAGHYAIKCGILQYLGGFTVKSPELLLVITPLWMQMVRADPCRGCAELQQYQGEKHLTNLLKLDSSTIQCTVAGEGFNHVEDAPQTRDSSPKGSPTTSGPTEKVEKPQFYYLLKDCSVNRCKSIACYILCQFLLRGEKQCTLCWNNRLLNAAFPCLSADCPELQSWACLLLSTLFSGLRHAKRFAAKECTTRFSLFTALLDNPSPIVRSSCVTLLASIVGTRADLLPEDQQLRFLQMEKTLLIKLRNYLFDASVNVREEIIYFCCQILYSYKGALPSRYIGITAIQDYVADIGRPSLSWTLEEPEVGVKSQLHAARPTVNAHFNDAVVFETTFLTSDDPSPESPDIAPESLCPTALTIVEGLLHDAAQMLCVLSYNCDAGLVSTALKRLSNGGAPVSQRFAFEAFRNMCSVTSVIVTLTEADRTRATSNTDIMRQLVLDLKTRKIGQPHGGDLGGEEDPTEMTNYEQRKDPWSVGATSLSSAAKYQIISGAVQADMVVCADFRALEASMVVATRKQVVHYISYDSYSSQEIVNSFPVRLPGPVHDVKVINDLSEQSGILLVNKKGGFNLLKNCWEAGQAPVEVAVFSACPPAENRWIDLKTCYRSSDATLIFGGPIGASGGTEIHTLSLATEQVGQRIGVPGSAVLTTLASASAQRGLLAGFSDAVVRYYDDRQGMFGMVGVLQCGTDPSTRAIEPLLGVGRWSRGQPPTLSQVAAPRYVCLI